MCCKKSLPSACPLFVDVCCHSGDPNALKAVVVSSPGMGLSFVRRHPFEQLHVLGVGYADGGEGGHDRQIGHGAD